MKYFKTHHQNDNIQRFVTQINALNNTNFPYWLHFCPIFALLVDEWTIPQFDKLLYSKTILAQLERAS